jgi:hypothetical protein
MLSDTFRERASRLIEVGFTECRRQLPLLLVKIDREATATGGYHSSARYLQIHRIVAQELHTRTIIIWRALVRVHQILGRSFTETLAQDLKSEFAFYLNEVRMELNGVLVEKIKDDKLLQRLTLDDAASDSLAKHNVEIDLYADDLRRLPAESESASLKHTYNFYGAVGTVQTGASAQANVVQHLGADEKQAILLAIAEVRKAIEAAHELGTQQGELIEITDECAMLTKADSPNNSKLRAMFDVLASSIQSVASARPAYEAMRAALLPLGITLP